MQTRLRDFMETNGISCVRLGVRAGVSSTHVVRLRGGKSDPRRPLMVALARSATAILRRKVRVTELFDLGDGEQ